MNEHEHEETHEHEPGPFPAEDLFPGIGENDGPRPFDDTSAFGTFAFGDPTPTDEE